MTNFETATQLLKEAQLSFNLGPNPTPQENLAFIEYLTNLTQEVCKNASLPGSLFPVQSTKKSTKS